MILPWIDKERYIQNLFERGDRRAMDKFYMEYADYLTGVCARYIADEDTLKDVVQESFIKIFTGIGEFTYRGKGSLEAWATKIAVNEALMQLRKDKLFIYSLQESEMDDSPDEDPDTEGLGMETLLSFIRKLPPGYRAVFNLFVIEEKSHKEIAEILQIQPATSASQFLRARKLLAEMIREYKHQMENR
jgi:RNA polymerase sigma-70 factor (ECF subfamily)